MRVPTVREEATGVKTIDPDFDAESATRSAASELLDELGCAPDLAIFTASLSEDECTSVPEILRDVFGPGTVLFGTASPLGVLGKGHEAQGMPGVSLLGGVLPDVRLATATTSDGHSLPELRWHRGRGGGSSSGGLGLGALSTLPEASSPHVLQAASTICE